jgi:hypothetical protein
MRVLCAATSKEHTIKVISAFIRASKQYFCPLSEPILRKSSDSFASFISLYPSRQGSIVKADGDNPEHYRKSDDYRKINQPRMVTGSPHGVTSKVGEVGKWRYQGNSLCNGWQLTQWDKNATDKH